MSVTSQTRSHAQLQQADGAEYQATFDAAFTRWLTWFGRHTPEWLETLVRCTGIHNHLTGVTFTPLERQFLANGLRFICSPPTSQLARFQADYLDDDQRGWRRFECSLRARLLNKLAGPDDDSTQTTIAKFRVRSKHTGLVERLELAQRGSSGADLQILDQYRSSTLRLLQAAVQDPQQPAQIARSRPNFTTSDSAFLRRLMGDASITAKPADKNLGLVLVDTSWYDTELRRMLSDTVTYRRVPTFRIVNNRRREFTPAHLIDELHIKLAALITRYSEAMKSACPELAETMLKYLARGVTKATAAVPGIYLLIKVHKPKGLCGRPIVPCTRWLTTPASVVVDHLLQQLLRDTRIPWLVKDTKSLVVELEHTTVPVSDGVFLTADIASLYTNIDTELGLTLVRAFLIERGLVSGQVELLMALLTFVMRNSYLTFKDVLYHQVDGTAMGTSVAPTYANIVVYMLERTLLSEFESQLYLYHRFLDDVLVYIHADAAASFQMRLNQLHPKLIFEFSAPSRSEASFLDLLVYKGARFASHHIFDLRVHQKSMNLYLYIPFHSFHTEAMKRSFIQTELMRYIRNSSAFDDYVQLKHVFYQRLRDRGYPSRFLQPLFNTIFYSDREYFLYPSAELLQHPQLAWRPPLSACLLRRIARAGCTAQQRMITASLSPPVFVIPFTPLSALVPTRQLLLRHWSQLQLIASVQRPIIAYQSMPSLLTKLVYTKARRAEEERRARFAVPVTTQSKLVVALRQQLPRTAPPPTPIHPHPSLLLRSSRVGDVLYQLPGAAQ